MSTNRLRHETNCLNCNTKVIGPYCHVCGQENIEPRDTFWGLVLHFFNDITHFEGKFITTLKLLYTKPGGLTVAYMKGERNKYMNPIRMYVFTSALFFISYFSFKSSQNESLIKLNASSSKKESAIAVNKGMPTIDTTANDSVSIQKILNRKAKSVKQYEAEQRLLPESQRDGWIKHALFTKLYVLQEKYKNNFNLFLKDVSNVMMHSLPKVLFISLPFFALLLKLLYIRHKSFFYVDHFIFTLHLFIFSFLNLLLDFLNNMIHWGFWPSDLISFSLIIYLFVYTFLALKRMYKQDNAATFLKFMGIGLGSFMIYMVLFIGLFSYALFAV